MGRPVVSPLNTPVIPRLLQQELTEGADTVPTHPAEYPENLLLDILKVNG